MFEDEITIFNKKYDETTRDYKYVRTYLIGVNLDLSKAANVIKSGLENANIGTLIIPEDVDSDNKIFTKPKEYKKAEDINTLWTLQPGDIIVAGIIDYIINENNTITNLKNVYDDVYEIVSVDTKLKGGLPHWEVGLK